MAIRALGYEVRDLGKTIKKYFHSLKTPLTFLQV